MELEPIELSVSVRFVADETEITYGELRESVRPQAERYFTDLCARYGFERVQKGYGLKNPIAAGMGNLTGERPSLVVFTCDFKPPKGTP